VLREQQDVGVSTGAGRSLRWTDGILQSTPGNSANAALAASGRAKKDLTKRRTVFKKAAVSAASLGHVNEVRILELYPLNLGDHGVVWTPEGIMLGHVVAMYSKTGGQHGKHQSVTTATNIAKLSYIAVQIFEYQSYLRAFTHLPEATSILRAKQFALLSSNAFLSVVNTIKPTPATDNQIRAAASADVTHSQRRLNDSELKVYQALAAEAEAFNRAMVLFRKRKIQDAAE